MLSVQPTVIAPDDNTCYLVGPEGLVWTQPAIGEPFILAARDDGEREGAARFVKALLDMGLVPFGVPLNQRASVAMFGNSPIRDCRWVPWADAPAPQGDLGMECRGDALPMVARVFDAGGDA